MDNGDQGSGGGGGLGDIFGKMQQFQQRMGDLQERLGQETVEGESGGGMVRAVVNGRRELLSLEIDPTISADGDREMLQDLVVAAVNAAMARTERLMQDKMQESLGPLAAGLPGFFKGGG